MISSQSTQARSAGSGRRLGMETRIPTTTSSSSQRILRVRPTASSQPHEGSSDTTDPATSRQSGIPRLNSRTSSSPAPLPSIAHGLSPPPTITRPATTSPSGIKPRELRRKQTQNTLRRKPSMVSRNASQPELPRQVSASPLQLKTTRTESPVTSFDISSQTNDFRSIHPKIPGLDRYGAKQDAVATPESGGQFSLGIFTHDLPPPTPLSSAGHQSRLSQYSGYSSSTRCSESPGPSVYSRDTTPTSVTSQSPSAITIPLYCGPRVRSSSPTNSRPPVTRRRLGTPVLDDGSFEPQGLPSLRESLASSSSNSTVKELDKSQVARKKKKPLSPPPPSPPPRKSSQKFAQPSGDEPRTTAPPPKTPVFSSPSSSGMASPQQAQKATLGRPRRPSREGTSDLARSPSDKIVVQSNLAAVSSSPKKTPEVISPVLSQSSQIRSPPHPLSRNTSQTSNMQSLESAPSRTGLGITPGLEGPPKSAPTPSPTTKSRFGFFSRRTKTPDQPKPTEKAARKGPTAGTGHEGYGKYTRGRSTSSNAAASREGSAQRNASQESLASNATKDKFLLERMSPVVIAGGGGIVENRNAGGDLSRIQSNQSAGGQSYAQSRDNLSLRSSSSREVESGRTTLWPSALPRSMGNNSTPHFPIYPAASDSSDAESVGHSRTIAYRRSMQRLKGQGFTPRDVPLQINTNSAALRPAITSNDTTILSDDSYLGDSAELGRSTKLIPPKKLSKRRPSSPRKWSLFSRNQAKKDDDPPVSVVVAVPPARPQAVAHYAMLDTSDPEPEPLGLDDLNIILKEAKGLVAISPANDSAASLPITETQGPRSAEERQESRPRLQQIGRIPRVNSSRPLHISPASFSRPFSDRNVPSQDVAQAETASGARTAERVPDMSTGTATAAAQPPESPEKISPIKQDRPFFVIKARQDSQGTSSSSDTLDWSNTTAIVPRPDAELDEDEVWDEYDDWIGEKAPPSAVSMTSSHGLPFQFEDFQVNVEAAAHEDAARTDDPQSSDMSLAAKVKEAFAGVVTPTTPGSFSDILTSYADRTHSTHGDSRTSKHLSIRSRGSSLSGHSRRSLLEITAQVAESPLADVNLRVASMNIAKWLTFSNVLFSPARAQILKTNDPVNPHSILVVDGLGNDDWSFYLAETYPHVTFYNLSPTPASPSGAQVTSALNMPTNHRQVQYARPTSKFPFAHHHFTAVIVRFPATGPEAAYRNLISESKRVLRAGGYLELSILDLDMMNMGVRTRRVVRELKVRLSQAQPDVSLAPASDTMLRLLGKRGFRDVKSCRLGVPVVGAVAAGAAAEERPRRHDDGDGIVDLMRDESAAGDESITKMVAKVGRWWHSQCYESALGAGSEARRSIWHDDKTLDECQRWGTDFKLLVCYAQKPLVARRRTASV